MKKRYAPGPDFSPTDDYGRGYIQPDRVMFPWPPLTGPFGPNWMLATSSHLIVNRQSSIVNWHGLLDVLYEYDYGVFISISGRKPCQASLPVRCTQTGVSTASLRKFVRNAGWRKAGTRDKGKRINCYSVPAAPRTQYAKNNIYRIGFERI